MTADVHPERHETSFEVAFDPEPEPARDPVFVDVVAKDEDRRPIVPAALRGRANLRATVVHAGGRWAHAAGYHGVRAPRYLALGAFWAVVGVVRLIGRQLGWWWLAEQGQLRRAAVTAGDPLTWLKLHKEAKATRRWRALVLLAELVALAVAAGLLWAAAPRWVVALVAVLAVPGLAHLGRPQTMPILRPAVVTARFRKLTADIVLRAYYAAGLGHLDKPGQQVTFGSVMAWDGQGSWVLVDLPYGKGLDDAVRARPAIAPHPDDEILGVGGLLALVGAAEVVAVTDGEASHPDSRVHTRRRWPASAGTRPPRRSPASASRRPRYAGWATRTTASTRRPWCGS